MKSIRLVILVIFSFLFLFPVLLTIFWSFISEDVIEDSLEKLLSGNGKLPLIHINDVRIFSLKQYESVLVTSPDYLFRFWRSLLLVLPIVFFHLVFSVPAAYAFSQTKSKILEGCFFLYILLFMIPTQVIIVPSYLFAKQINLVDTNWSIWLPGIFSGFSEFLLSRHMSRIPREILDAARLDGAGEIRLLLSIVSPMSKAGIFTCAILLFTDCWNMVELPIIMFSHPLKYPLSVFLSQIQKEAVGISFAADVVYLIPVIIVFLFGEEYLFDIFISE